MGTVSLVVAPRELGMNQNIFNRTAQNATRIAHWNIGIHTVKADQMALRTVRITPSSTRAQRIARSVPATWIPSLFHLRSKASLGVSLSGRQTPPPRATSMRSFPAWLLGPLQRTPRDFFNPCYLNGADQVTSNRDRSTYPHCTASSKRIHKQNGGSN